MTKISKLILGASVLGVMGFAALPVASYAAQDVLLQVSITEIDGDNGGNNQTGYKWFISDRDGGTTNMTADAGSDGNSTNGFSMIGTKVATSTGITGVNEYGFKAYYTNVVGGGAKTGILASDTQTSLANATFYYGTDLLVGAGATAANLANCEDTTSCTIDESSTPVALETAEAGTLNVMVPALITSDGSSAGGAGSWFKYDSSLPNGTYENTLTVTTIKKS